MRTKFILEQMVCGLMWDCSELRVCSMKSVRTLWLRSAVRFPEFRSLPLQRSKHEWSLGGGRFEREEVVQSWL